MQLHLQPQLLPVVLTFSFLLSSCSYKVYHQHETKLDIERLTAMDLEEDDYLLSTGQDEIELYYTLAALDENNRVVGIQRKHYGPQDFSYRGQSRSGYWPVNVTVPPKGKLYLSVHIIENDDYFQTKQYIDDAQTIVDVAEFVAKNSRKGKAAARTLRLISRRLHWLGIAVTVIDLIDTNDKLMGFCIVLDQEKLKKIAQQGKTRDQLRSTGSNWGDRYDYRVDLSLLVKENFFGPEIKERIKAKAPNIVINLSPFMIDQNLNDYWLRSRDRLLEPSGNSSNEYEFSDGLYNMNFAASLAFALAPSFKMNRKETARGKFYLQGGYRRLPYHLNFDHSYILDNQYFQNTSGLPSDPSVDDIELDLTQFSGAALFKVVGRNVIWDIGGGVLHHQGKTRFHNLSLDNPQASFVYDENQNILEEDLIPFGFTKLGFGKINRNSGYTINLGVMAFQPQYTTNSLFGIYKNDENNPPTPVPAGTENWRFSASIGLDLFF